MDRPGRCRARGDAACHDGVHLRAHAVPRRAGVASLRAGTGPSRSQRSFGSAHVTPIPPSTVTTIVAIANAAFRAARRPQHAMSSPVSAYPKHESARTLTTSDDYHVRGLDRRDAVSAARSDLSSSSRMPHFAIGQPVGVGSDEVHWGYAARGLCPAASRIPVRGVDQVMTKNRRAASATGAQMLGASLDSLGSPGENWSLEISVWGAVESVRGAWSAVARRARR